VAARHDPASDHGNAATPAPTLSVSPASLSFNYQSGGATPAAQTFAVSSSGSALSYTTATSATWLAATPAAAPRRAM